MSNEKDIFEKMDALVRKHHPVPAQPASIATTQTKPARADIPMLTDVIAEPGLDTELRHDLIPLLTETFDPRPVAAPSAKPVLELDLDPFFTLPAPAQQATLPKKAKAEPVAQPVPANTESTPLPKLDNSGPLFTEIIELNTPDTPPPAEAPLEPAASPTSAMMSSDALAHFSEALSEQLMRAIDTRLQQAVDKKIAPQLAQTVDKALSSMLDQFSVNIEDMVRESIAQELQRQLSALLNTPSKSNSAPTTSNHSAKTGDSV